VRKRIIDPKTSAASPPASGWLDVELIAEVDLTSEDPAYPIESALRPGDGPGWRAAEPGRQTIRFRFDAPQHIRRVRLVFQERSAGRTQEFVLRRSSDQGVTFQEVVRQQYTFSPPGTTEEVEDYTLDVEGVTTLELNINPDIDGSESFASLAGLFLE